ncbi:uncharacterized protein LOC106672158 [Cimex lectularius]|uniref:CBM39 domain-containing protein n=1 Tax=Cimex lectularius TaxID=79782 RepID=A0A8I6S918_CIMLE|nr:uncharacterized protein LOC106672158 [Cimex lectularius]
MYDMTTVAGFFVAASIALLAGPSSSQFLPVHFVHFHTPIYTIPPLTFQALLGGGFRAYLPDDCGVENFEFKCKKNKDEDWKGGNVTSKMANHWVFEDPLLSLNPGDRLLYGGSVTNRGRQYPINEDAEWIVPQDLPESFSPPQVEQPPRCPEEEQPEEESPKKEKEPTTKKPKMNKEPELEENDNSTTASTTTTMTSTEPTTTTTTTTTEYPSLDVPKCPWVDITPIDTREKALQNSLGRMQCELASFAAKTARVNRQLTEELIDLKKLNYATVARMQRLESLLRSLPRGIPYPLF